MSTVDQIVIAASQLDPRQFLALRRKLDRLERRIWATELASATAKMAKNRITDREIDKMLMRRRHEGRR